MQPVEDASPWPEMQRFDFLVRTRAVTEAEATEMPGKAGPAGSRAVRRRTSAALVALRELTGKDAKPTAEAWRRVLELPAVQR